MITSELEFVLRLSLEEADLLGAVLGNVDTDNLESTKSQDLVLKIYTLLTEDR